MGACPWRNVRKNSETVCGLSVGDWFAVLFVIHSSQKNARKHILREYNRYFNFDVGFKGRTI